MSKKRSRNIRHNSNISLGDALSAFSKENKLDKRFESIRVEEAFIESVPESFRKYIGKMSFGNGILTVYVSSASFRQNLQMASSSLCDIINEKLKATIVHKILLS